MEHNEDYSAPKKSGKQHNVLPLWGNEASMNLNPLILANIQGSSYFKVHLFKLKTYHEVVDEIYYQVKHLEPWERGSRKTAGQTGMCGGVRGVGAGGIVSTAFCLLYKLYTLRLTRKQVNGLLTHTDSPYIRALGFMYIRYTQPPGDLYDWYEDYLLDEEDIDVKAGGGQVITIGQMAYQFLTKLDWFSTLFPRIPVPIQKQIEKKLNDFSRSNNINFHTLHQQNAAVQRSNNYPSASSGSGGGGGVSGSGADFNNGRGASNYGGSSVTERDRERDSKEYDRRRYDERERERESREHYRYHDDRREDRYEKSRSRERHEHRSDKHKRKHKTKDRDRSRSKERRDRDHYRDRQRERDHDRRYR